MSGGSYNYLYCQGPDDLLGSEEDLQQMADRLAGLGYAQDAAKETMAVLLTVRQMKNRLEAMRERMEPVWRAVEWLDSGDSGEDGVKAALAKYRGNVAPTDSEEEAR